MKTISPQKIVDYLDRRYDEQTRSAVEEWMTRSEENRDEFFRIKQLWALKNTYKHASASEVEGAVRKINQQLDQRRRIRRLQYLARTAVAAALLFGAILTGIGVDKYRERFEWHTIANTVSGEVLDFVLDDGTRVYLNQGGELSFREDFDTRRRRVKLSGEAFFDVASDRDHLFFVKTNTVVVKVVGTSFNVKMYKDTDDTEVVLERGVVKLQFGDNDNMITMQPGQKIYYSSASHDISISEVNVEYLMLLKYGMISMSDVRVAEIIRKVEEIYSVDIETVAPLDDDRLYNFNFLKSNTLDDVLDIIEKMSGVKCRPAPAAGAE